jgi:hypothetical protein
MYRVAISAAVAATLLAGCASRSENITAAYVSPLTYESYNCRQLGEEATRVSTRAAQAMGAQDSKATGDAVATGVGLILFWPAVFFIKGDGASAAEVARMKGEMEAIEQASIRKDCGIKFERPAAAS